MSADSYPHDPSTVKHALAVARHQAEQWLLHTAQHCWRCNQPVGDLDWQRNRCPNCETELDPFKDQ